MPILKGKDIWQQTLVDYISSGSFCSSQGTHTMYNEQLIWCALFLLCVFPESQMGMYHLAKELLWFEISAFQMFDTDDDSE